MQELLAASKPKWTFEDRYHCETRLGKIGIDGAESLAEAVVRGLNHRLADSGLGLLANSTLEGMTRLLWEDPGGEGEESAGDVRNASDEEVDGAAELARELMLPLWDMLEEQERCATPPPRAPSPQRPRSRVATAETFASSAASFCSLDDEVRETAAAMAMALEDASDAHSDAADSERGDELEIFDADPSVWASPSAASPSEVQKSREARSPSFHALDSLCNWEAEERSPAPPADEIFDAPAHEWTFLPAEEGPSQSKGSGGRKACLPTELVTTPVLAGRLGALLGSIMAFRAAAASRCFRDWLLPVLPQIVRWVPEDVYVFGGHELRGRYGASPACARLSLRSNSWEPLPPMSSKRTFATSVSYLGKVYVLGGSDGVRFLDSCEALDLVSRRWQSLPPMSVARCGCGAAALCGSVYVVGGVAAGAGAHDAYERLEAGPLRQGRWRPVPPTSLGCSAEVAVASLRRKLYVAGFLQGQCQFERFCPALEAWERLPPLEPRLAKNVLSGAVGIGERLYVCSVRILAVRIFNTRRGMWEAPPRTSDIPDKLLTGRPSSCTSAAGQLLILGGWKEKGRPRAGCVAYGNIHRQLRRKGSGAGRFASWSILPFGGGPFRMGATAAAARR